MKRSAATRSCLALAAIAATFLLMPSKSDAARLRFFDPWEFRFVRPAPPFSIERPRARKPKRKHVDDAKLPKGAIPPGPRHIVVSIADQRVTLYSGGVAVAQGRISTGVPSHPTPTGVFSVIQKSRWHRSNLYSNAPMPWMQRLTWSGVALHEGPLPGYPASHGCIRLTHDFAALLWRTTTLGTRVIVSHDPVAPSEFEHAHLFVAKPVGLPPALNRPVEPASPDNSSKTANSGIDEATAVRRSFAMASEASARSEGRVMQTNAGRDLPSTSLNETRPSTPVSMFISRKLGKLFVRQKFQPVFDVPVVIRDPRRPLGTHVFTAMEVKRDSGATRWTALTMPGKTPAGAAEALDRLELPPDAVERISRLLTPGASLVVSDEGLGAETGVGTDFIVLTR